MDNNEILKITFEKENKLLKSNYDKLFEEQSVKYNELNELFQQEKEKYKVDLKQYHKDQERLKLLEQERDELRQQLDSILYSRSYKISQKLKKIIGK